MDFFRALRRSYLPELFIFILFCLWVASIVFGVKGYLLLAEVHAIDPSRPAPSFHWARYLPGLFFVLYFIWMRLRQRKAFNK